MFEQHPVPQQISSYQFRLVGDMTLKQFFQLAGGAIIALIIYSLPLPGIVKWPLVAISAISGAAFAFLPLQDRPLEQWIAAFFRSIYSPTLFVWKKEEPATTYFQTTVSPQEQAVDTQPVPADTAILPEEHSKETLDAVEENYLEKVTNMFNQKAATPTTTTKPTIKPSIIVPAQTSANIKPQGFSQEAVKAAAAGVKTTNIYQTFQPTATQQAQFSPLAAPPLTPSIPNIIVGQMLDSAVPIVEGVILEIKDQQGRPVRALKSNKAGHFMIVTPLPAGTYRIISEKEGLTFVPI